MRCGKNRELSSRMSAMRAITLRQSQILRNADRSQAHGKRLYAERK